MSSIARFGSSMLLLSPLIAAACSSGTTGTVASPADGGTSSSNGASGALCGLALTGPKWAASCQTWSDQYCCNEQKACAADAACAKLIACIEACPTPRNDVCLNACSPDGGPAGKLLDAFGNCTRATPAGGQDLPATCEWPTG
jgi:hypothetical protein